MHFPTLFISTVIFFLAVDIIMESNVHSFCFYLTEDFFLSLPHVSSSKNLTPPPTSTSRLLNKLKNQALL